MFYAIDKILSPLREANSHFVANRATCNDLNTNAHCEVVIPQSSFTVSTGTKETDSQNVEFMDTNPAYNYVVDHADDPTRGIADMGDASLGNFLSRPILIKEYSWSPSVAFYESFNPWKLFMDNVQNVNRVANFNLMRSRLCVRFLVNGNGFYYGRLLASYVPLPAYDEVSVTRGLGLDVDNIGASQRPHIYINPTECQGGDLCVPFVWPHNALSVPSADWEGLGTIYMTTLTNLKNANGATDPITVSVFAYLEDVNLSIPTAAQPANIQPQAGGDEYGDSPISGPASTVARVAGMLTSVPVIAPFAKATTIAANAVGGIAKLFGMSRPAVIEPIQVYKPEYVGGLANTNTPDGTNKLSMDVKQEVTIDPSVVGVGSRDEMSLVDVAMRESYYTSFTWDPAGGDKAGAGFQLFSTEVSPTIYQSHATGPRTEFHCLPCGLAAIPFDYWGGSMEFRFQIVCSNFHRGRIRVVWDPESTATIGSGGYNTAYNRIIDITDMKDFTVKVGWGQKDSFLPVLSPSARVGGVLIPSFRAGSGAPLTNTGNGTLSVYVVNDLTVPNSSVDNTVEINVFAKMCDDARFAQPADMGKRSLTYFIPPEVVTPQSLETVVPQAGEEMVEQEMAPVSDNVDTDVASGQPTTDHMMDVFYGEQITSIRQMLKRYCFHSLTPVGGGDGSADASAATTVIMPDFPYYVGYCPNGISETTSGDRFNYCQNTYLNWFAPSFVAYRGGLRWKHFFVDSNASNAATTAPSDYFAVSRSSGVNLTNNTAATSAGNDYIPYSRLVNGNFLNKPSTTAFQMQRDSVFLVNSLTVGGFVTPKQVNPCAEVELPYYNQRRFMGARQINNLNPRQQGQECPPVHRIDHIGPGGGVFNYVAAAEDFSLSFFLSVPIMYSLGTVSPNPFPNIAA